MKEQEGVKSHSSVMERELTKSNEVARKVYALLDRMPYGISSLDCLKKRSFCKQSFFDNTESANKGGKII